MEESENSRRCWSGCATCALFRTNLDEFFEIRVAGLREQFALQRQRHRPGEPVARARGARPGEPARPRARRPPVPGAQRRAPAGDGRRGHPHPQARRPDAGQQREWVNDHFSTQVLPVLTPMGLDPAHPFPRILNKALTFIISLDGADAFGRDSGIAVLQVPRCLPRLIALPKSVSESNHEFVLLSSVIHAHIGELFPGMRVTGCHQFRVTRDSDLWVDEEESQDLLAALKGELPNRKWGEAVRIEVDDKCKTRITKFLLQKFNLTRQDMYRVNGPVNLHRLDAIYDLVDRADLKFPPYTPVVPAEVARSDDMFDFIRRNDLLLHHPFQSFSPVVDLLNQAAVDKDVLAIKMTLYRTGAESPLIDALIQAARNGKEVTAVVELRARFDEERNIHLATRLQEVGATVAYGIVGHKTHAKMLLIVRREPNGLRRYVHLGTGNYHIRTTRQYTDFSLMTAGRRLGEDVHNLFLQLTSPGKVRPLRKLLQSPFTLHERVLSS